MTNDPNDWNGQIISEFRENAGKVGGMFENATLILLHTIGAKSGADRINPLAASVLGDGRAAVFGSKAGATSHHVILGPRHAAGGRPDECSRCWSSDERPNRTPRGQTGHSAAYRAVQKSAGHESGRCC